MPEHEIRHPLKRLRFYAECIRYATTGAWGMVGDFSTALPLAGLLFKVLTPNSYSVAAKFLKVHHVGEEWILLIPAGVGGLILLGRLVTAPFVLYRGKPDAKSASSESLRNKASRLAAEIAQFVAMRRENKPHRRIIDSMNLLNDMPAELRYAGETATLYAESFLKRVNDIREELSLVGVIDTRLDEANANPALAENTQTISDRLRDLATRLQDDAIGDIAALHQANTLLKNELDELREQSLPRRLGEDQQRAIAQVVRAGLHDLWERHRSSPSWSSDDKEELIFVELYSVESERETAVYRADFAKALQDGGLGVALGEIVGTLGEQGNEEFIGVVSILRGRPGNLVRPFVLEALRSAGISVNECDNLPNGLARYNHGKGGESLGVTLVIGQRG